MSLQPPKMVAIGFSRISKNPLLQSFEELYIYGVLSQLARFTELQYKDLGTTHEKIVLDPTLSYDEVLKKLQQVCQSTRTQYLMTGTLNPIAGDDSPFHEIKVTYRLYDVRRNQYIVDEVVNLPMREAVSEDGQNLDMPVEPLNQLINATTAQFARAIFGDNLHHPVATAPFSTSLKAMYLVLKAHQTTSQDEKIQLYTQAAKEDPQLETAYYHLARIYKGEPDYEKAVLNYREALKVSHGSPRNKAMYATDAGIACALLGKPDFAQQWWLRAIEYDPSYINPYFNIANIFEDQENYEQAETYFRKAQELAPDDFRTFFNLARIYSKMGAWEQALSQYHRQLETEDGDPWCHSDVATCYLNLGDLPNARVHLEKTIKIDPDGEAGQYAQLILSGMG